MIGSPSRLSDPIEARDCSVMRLCCASLTSSVTSTSAPGELDLGHLADVDTGDADDRAGLQPGDVGELRLERVALPGEAALAADGDDQHGGEHERRDAEDADLQLRPGE